MRFGHCTERHVHHCKCSSRDTFISPCVGPESIPLPRGLAARAQGQIRYSAVEGGLPPAGDHGQRPPEASQGGLTRADSAFPRQLLLSWATTLVSHMNPATLQPCSCLASSPVGSDPDTQADALASPQPCLITVDLPGVCWAVPYPGCPDQAYPAHLSQAP